MKYYGRLTLLLCLAAIAAACGGSGQQPASQPLEIVEATFAHGLSEQMEPANPGNAFQPDETVYLSLKLNGNPKEGMVSARFYYQDQEIDEARVDLAEARTEQGLIFTVGGNTFVGFTLSHDEPFPISENYRAEVFLNGRPAGTHPFVVVQAAGAVSSRVIEAVLARGATDSYQPIDPTDTFAPTDTVHVVGKMDLGLHSQVEVNWYVAGALDEEGTRSLTAQEDIEDSGFYFFFLPEGGWPAGEHRAVLLINDKEVSSYTFTVSEAATAAGAGAVSTLQDVKSATIQIEAVGSFMHPEEGQQQNVAGAGSGFIIDPAGIAVTNNHVVTGAAILKVWVGGGAGPRNAKILGVSECADLAVIDIDGDDFSYLEWYAGDIAAGLPIYAAGFPLGDPEYTLLQGIVSKERASGESEWASVDHVIEHTALTNPGSSGGPIVTEDGKVVAVHYAGNSETEQHFAIARDAARPVIEQLRAGHDVFSIGVNGEAITLDEDISGIWVASVASGSPADKAGVKAGDVIYSLEGLVLATDGTLKDYCDVLRSHDPDDTLSLEVIRFATEEVLEGQINGRVLEQSFSFAQELESGTSGASASYSSYVETNDGSSALRVDIPAEWSDVNGSPWEIEEKTVGAAIAAAGNLDDFYGTWSEAGVFFGASSVLAQEYDATALLDLDQYDFSDECEYKGRSDYEDPLYTGVYDHWTNCGGLDTQFIVLAAAPEDQSFVILVQIQVVSDADLEALDKILNTFEVIGDLPSE